MEYYAVVFKGESLEHASRNVDDRGWLQSYKQRDWGGSRGSYTYKSVTRQMTPGVQGYDTEYNRKKEADSQKEMAKSKKMLSALIRELEVLNKEADDLYKNSRGGVPNAAEVKRIRGQRSSRLETVRNIIKMYPALKADIPESIRKQL